LSEAAVFSASHAKPLSKVISRCFNPDSGLQHIAWSDKVFCTRNFVRTIGDHTMLGQYLRPVGSFLYFPQSKRVLLLSEREADSITSTFARQLQGPRMFLSCGACHDVVFSHMFQAHLAFNSDIEHQHIEPLRVLPVDAFASLQLFSGESTFPTEEQKAHLREVAFASALAKQAAASLPSIRGLQDKFSRSDLELITHL
jgi:hypothetical protein